MRRVVLDCSVALSWFFEDESNTKADAALDLLSRREAVVPPLWFYEISNAILIAESRKRISEADAARIVELLNELPVVSGATSIGNAAIETRLLAKEHNLSAYDAAYLELAMREGLALATLDTGLKKAAKKQGLKC